MRKLLEEIRDALNDIDDIDHRGLEVCLMSDLDRVKDLVHKMLMDVE